MNRVRIPVHNIASNRGTFCLASVLWVLAIATPGWCGPSMSPNPRTAENYRKLPLSFAVNAGQFDPGVDFVAQGPGYRLWLQPSEAVLGLRDGVVRMQLVGANPSASAVTLEPLPGRVNYLNGTDSRHWQTGIPTFGKVQYESVYRGVDLVYYGNQGRLEWDFVVSPGADPSAIALAFEGADSLHLEKAGDLALCVGDTEVQFRRPRSYQLLDGKQVEVASRYAIEPAGTVVVHVDEYDRSQPLVIDPVLVYGTYFHGSCVSSFADLPHGIAVDAGGNACIAGETCSGDLPTTVGAYNTTTNGQGDAYVTKLSDDGSALAYCTYLGGSGRDRAFTVALDSEGNAYVAGDTFSTNFPTLNGFSTNVVTGASRGFLTVLTADGSDVLYSTYIGTNGSTFPYGIAVDAAKFAYVAGYTSSGNFPVTPGALDTTPDPEFGGFEGIVVKVDTLQTGTASLVYSTYLGGRGPDFGNSIAADTNGSAYVVGTTYASNFPVVNAFQTLSGAVTYPNLGYKSQVFLSRINPTGTALEYSTYLGGANDQLYPSVAVTPSGVACVKLLTLSTNFPTTATAYDTTYNGSSDLAVTVLDTKLSGTNSLVYSTFLGGSAEEQITDINGHGGEIAVDAAGVVYLTGNTLSSNFPTTSDAFDKTRASDDVVVVKLNPNLAGAAGLVYSTFLGGSGSEGAEGIAIDTAGNMYVTGYTTSSDFPATAGALDTSSPGGGLYSGFIVKIGQTNQVSAISCSLTPGVATNVVGDIHTVTSTVTSNGVPLSGLTVDFHVTAGPDIGAAGTDVTDLSGAAVFTYTNNGTTGTDSIHATGHVNSVSFSCTATKVWTPPLPDLTVAITNADFTCTNTTKGTVCTNAGTLLLANNGAAYGNAMFAITTTKQQKLGKPPTWKVAGTINVFSFNLGVTPASLLQVYLSSNTALDSSDIPLLKKPVSTSALNALLGTGKILKVKLAAPKGVDLTGQYLIAQVDAVDPKTGTDSVTETDETNNTAAFGPIP